ncbi:MAG: SEL1-like repeat protein [Endomicrobium sp.]|jgi:TPR repeat protein|nr:SEL1-like repeat protein [Endomicrobium sp.]
MRTLLIFAVCFLACVFVCVCDAADKNKRMRFNEQKEASSFGGFGNVSNVTIDGRGRKISGANISDLIVTESGGKKEIAEKTEDSVFLQTKKSAEAGNVASQIKLAEIYIRRSSDARWRRFIVNGDLVEAAAWYRKAAEQGSSDAQYELGEMYYYGRGVNKISDEAFKWFEKSAEQGNIEARKMLKKFEIKDPFFEQTKKSAEAGYAESQLALGKIYYEHKELKKDYAAEAVKWYKEAAEQGLAEAQYILASMYSAGREIGRNYTEAARWYENAAEQGHAEAQYTTGGLYNADNGVKKDRAEAIKWYTRAAEQGHTKSQYQLGSMYLGSEFSGGEGTEKDLAEAEKWLKRASARGDKSAKQKLEKVAFFEQTKKSAEAGNAESQFKLGKIYLNQYGGFGYDRDKAAAWLKKSAEQGHKEAEEMLTRNMLK